MCSIDEAVKALPARPTGRRTGVPWFDIERVRDVIGHHCAKLDAQIVRATIGEPLARLPSACEMLAAGADPEG